MKCLANFICVGALFFSLPANGQETGTHIGPGPAQVAHGTMSAVDRGRITMQKYANCLGEDYRRGVENYLKTFPGSAASSKSVRELTSRGCWSDGEVKFQEGLFRGSAYEYFYRTDFLRSKMPDFSAIPAFDFTTGETAENKGAEEVQIGLRKFADCVVRENTGNAHALMFSYLASDEEKRIIGLLRPTFSSCMSKTLDMTIKFSTSMLRGLIAEMLYRNAKSIPAGLASAKDDR